MTASLAQRCVSKVHAHCLLAGHDWALDVSRAFKDGIVRRVCRRCQKAKRYQPMRKTD